MSPSQLGRLAAATAGSAALFVYLLTLAPDLTWAHHGADGGELITAAVTFGVPHPPGYPLYVVLGRLAAYLPLGTVAWRFHLFSAVCTAGAVALLARTALHLTPANDRSGRAAVVPAVAAALAAALAAAWAPLVWSQALIAEVYALNLLAVSVVVWAALTQRPSALIGLAWGIAVTTHLTSVLLAPLVLWSVWHRPGRLWLLPGCLLGSTPWALLPWLARSGSPVIWGDPTTWQGWWWLVSAALYRPNVWRWPGRERLAADLWLLLRQLHGVGWLLLPAAFIGRPRPPALWALAAAAALYLLYGLGYATGDAAVNWLPGLWLCGLLLTPALQRLGPAALLLPALALGLNYASADLHGDRALRAAVQTVWAELPPDALAVTAADHAIFALWYFQHVEGQRRDVVLIDDNLFQFDWYRRRLQAAYPRLPVPEQDDLSALRAALNGRRPICDVALQPAVVVGCR